MNAYANSQLKVSLIDLVVEAASLDGETPRSTPAWLDEILSAKGDPPWTISTAQAVVKVMIEDLSDLMINCLRIQVNNRA